MPKRGHTTNSTSGADNPELTAAVEQLIAVFHPDYIYLFGSMADGTATADSSADVLIVAPEVSSIRFLERIKRAVKATEDTLPSIAPLVYTPAEVEVLTKQGDGFMTEVLEHGQVLYDRKAV